MVGVVSKYTVMMKKIVLPIVLLTLLPPVLPASLRECLLGYKLLHPGTGRCFTALERGPCQAGSWLVPTGGGEAECRPETTGQCAQPVVLTGGEVGCLVVLSTNLREDSLCLEKAPTRTFSSLKVPSLLARINNIATHHFIEDLKAFFYTLPDRLF